MARDSSLPPFIADNRSLWLSTLAIGMFAVLLQVAGFPVLQYVGFWDSYLLMLLTGLVALVLRLLVTRLRTVDEDGRFLADTREGWRRTWATMRRDYLHGRAVLRAVVALLLLSFLGTIFLGWKHLIPSVVPFYLDPHLERWDTLLHGGRPLWDWLASLNSPFTAWAFDRLYFLVNWGVLIGTAWVAWSQHPLRGPFLMGSVVIWFGLGAVMATLLSSAGPMYAAPSFEAQGQYLRSLPDLMAPRAWDLLAQVHLSGGTGHPYAAISAMPSLHVAVPALLFFGGTTRYPRLLWPGLVYMVLTLLSTVYLGWHYALDGYVSIAAVGIYWRVCGRQKRGTGERT
jgi:hypothetical protein